MKISQDQTRKQVKPKGYASKLIQALKTLRGLPASIILLLFLLLLIIISLGLGRYPVTADQVFQILSSHILSIGAQFLNILSLGYTHFSISTPLSIPDTVVMQIRFPRIVAAMLVGGTLSLAGGSFQGLFRNPLVSPDILGVSAGAGFGAALAILLNSSQVTIEVSAFSFALIAVGIAYGVSKIVKGSRTLSLILAGLAISSLFNASLAFIEYISNPTTQLPTIIFWLMGSLANVISFDSISVAAIPMVIGIVVLILMRWRFNVLAMGEEEAQALGINTGRMRAVIVVCCTLISAAAVCIAGIVGWVGLVIPHISRLLVGPDHKRLLPVSLLLGASYLLLIDDVARTASNLEIPLGILTAMIGAPFFIYMLSRRGRGWS